MPAVAVLCGIYWPRIPRWVLTITLAACAVLGLTLLAGAALLTGKLPGVTSYGAIGWILLTTVPIVAVAGLLRKNWTRALALPAVLLVYFGFAVFLRPFDGPQGAFPPAALEAARNNVVVVPSPFTARDEIYRFLLPGADVRRIKTKELTNALGNSEADLFIVPVALDAPTTLPGFRVLGTRLKLNDYFTAEQTNEMLRGHIARHVFVRELLVARESPETSGPAQP
jgi:hypothetical protein